MIQKPEVGLVILVKPTSLVSRWIIFQIFIPINSMSLTPYVARQAINSPYVRSTVVPYLGVLGFNEATRQVRTAVRNVQNLAEDAQDLYHKVRMALPTPSRLFTPRRASSPYVRRTPMSRTPRRRAAMRRRFRAARRSPIYRRASPLSKTVRTIGKNVPYKSPTVKRSYNLSPYTFCNKLLGEVPGTQFKSKAAFFETSSWTALPSLTLLTLNLIRIPWNDNESLGNRRATGTVHLTGIKLRMKFKLNDAFSGSPMTCRWAIVVNKESVADTAASLPDANFFAKFEDQDAVDEGQTFATNYSANRMDAQKINPDKYCVIRQGRFSLTKNGDGAVNPIYAGGGNKQFDQYALINQYMKFNTNVRFAENADTSAGSKPTDNSVFLAIWFYRADKDAVVTASEANAVFYQDYLKCYWKDVGWGVGR